MGVYWYGSPIHEIKRWQKWTGLFQVCEASRRQTICLCCHWGVASKCVWKQLNCALAEPWWKLCIDVGFRSTKLISYDYLMIIHNSSWVKNQETWCISNMAVGPLTYPSCSHPMASHLELLEHQAVELVDFSPNHFWPTTSHNHKSGVSTILAFLVSPIINQFYHHQPIFWQTFWLMA